MDFAEIKQYANMNSLFDRLGIALDKTGRCACPIHGGDNKTAFAVHSKGQGWTCHTKCEESGDIFSFIERYEGISNPASRIRVMEIFGLDGPPEQKPKPAQKKPKGKEVGRKEYVYHDKHGKELFKTIRIDYDSGKKECRQECNGKPSLPKDVRTLYNLDMIYENTGEYVVICEGEKCADAITDCGFIGTTNPLGSKNWDESYAQHLKEQRVLIIPDADSHGEKWRDEVLTSLQGVVLQVQVLAIPDSFIKDNPQFSGHDIADYAEVLGIETAQGLIQDGIKNAKVLPRGVNPDLLGRPCDIFDEILKRSALGISTTVFNFSEWLPSYNMNIKQGDLVVIMANTGVGKTRITHNIPYHIRRLNYAVFDLELSKETLAMRYAAMENGVSFTAIDDRLEAGYKVKRVDIDHVFIQKVEQLTVEKIRDRVALLERVTGREMHVVCVDYIGLMSGSGSLYERTSANVEAFKAYISDAGKVGIMTTQISRPSDKDNGQYDCPSVFAAKNSGSIECSTQALFGFWKDKNIDNRLWSAALKYSHGSYPLHDVPLVANNLLIREDVYNGQSERDTISDE